MLQTRCLTSCERGCAIVICQGMTGFHYLHTKGLLELVLSSLVAMWKNTGTSPG